MYINKIIDHRKTFQFGLAETKSWRVSPKYFRNDRVIFYFNRL